MPLNYQAVLAPYQGKGTPMARCAGAQELQARWAPEANRKDSNGVGASHCGGGFAPPNSSFFPLGFFSDCNSVTD